MNTIEYKNEIASILKCNPENIFLYWKGRVALYAILKALNLNAGDEVIIPAFTCVVVPNAILYAGLKPVYVDISESTFNINISLIESAITTKTKVIVCQNTFGLSSNIEEIILIAKKNNLYTVEDCTHGFGGFYNGHPNGFYCDAAFYSTQWNKPFSTGIGGFLVANNQELSSKLKLLEAEKIQPRLDERVLLKFLLIFRNLMVNKFTQNTFVNIYRFLSKHNLIIGSNQGSELNSTQIPIAYFKDISNTQIKTGIKKLKFIDDLNRLRRKNAEEYTAFLKSKGKKYIDEKYFNNHMFLKYPLIVKDRNSVFEIAKKSNINLGDWFLSPLHPITEDLSLWMFEEKKFPNSVRISKFIVNLPTDINSNKAVLKFLNDNLSLIS